MSRARDSEATTLAAHLALSPCAIPTTIVHSTVRTLVVDLLYKNPRLLLYLFNCILREVRSSDLCFLNDRAVLLHL